MNNEFRNYHPIVNFAFFLFIIGFSCIFMHPICLTLSLCGAFSYSVMLKGTKAIKQNIIYMLPSVAVMALLNPAFNHGGMTILAYLPSGNPLTLESIIYGIAAAVMIITLICWFMSSSLILTSDKFIYLFGRILPSLSLVLSMTMRFVPRFTAQMKKTADAQRAIGKGIKNGGIVERTKNSVRIISVMITWALENAVDTADSMKARGYGTKKRTSFSVFRFDTRDRFALTLILALGIYIIVGSALGAIEYTYFPVFAFKIKSAYGITVAIAYALLSFTPVIIEISEKILWNATKLKT